MSDCHRHYTSNLGSDGVSLAESCGACKLSKEVNRRQCSGCLGYSFEQREYRNWHCTDCGGRVLRHPWVREGDIPPPHEYLRLLQDYTLYKTGGCGGVRSGRRVAELGRGDIVEVTYVKEEVEWALEPPLRRLPAKYRPASFEVVTRGGVTGSLQSYGSKDPVVVPHYGDVDRGADHCYEAARRKQ